MTNKKTKAVRDSFIGIVHESKHKLNKLWVDQGKEFYNELMQNGLTMF